MRLGGVGEDLLVPLHLGAGVQHDRVATRAVGRIREAADDTIRQAALGANQRVLLQPRQVTHRHLAAELFDLGCRLFRIRFPLAI